MLSSQLSNMKWHDHSLNFVGTVNVNATHHACSLAVPDVGVEPSDATEHTPESWDACTTDVTETRVTGQRSQQILRQNNQMYYSVKFMRRKSGD